MIGFLLINLVGMTVNMMLMFGMVLTVGMLVDGAIVIVEYADRKMAEGLERKAAYILAAQRMFWPIVSSTGTTLAAFLPMLFWPGVPGEFMSYPADHGDHRADGGTDYGNGVPAGSRLDFRKDRTARHRRLP